MNLQDWIPFVGTVALVLIFWRQGGNSASTQVIATYKEQVEQLRNQVSELTARVGELTGELKEKDARIASLELVSLDKNPQFMEFMKNMTDAVNRSDVMAGEAQQYMQDTTEYLHTIKNALTVRALDDQIDRKRKTIKNLNQKI